MVSESGSLGGGIADGRFVVGFEDDFLPIIDNCITTTLPKLNVISPQE